MPTCNNTNCMATGSVEELEWQLDVYGKTYCKPCNQYLKKHIGRQRPYKLAARRPVGCDEHAYNRHCKAITEPESEPVLASDGQGIAAETPAAQQIKRTASQFVLHEAEADPGMHIPQDGRADMWASPGRFAKRACFSPYVNACQGARRLFADSRDHASQTAAAEAPSSDAAAEATEALILLKDERAQPGRKKPIQLPPLRCDSTIPVYRDAVSEVQDSVAPAVERSLSLALSLPDNDLDNAEDAQDRPAKHVNWYLPRSPTELSPNGRRLYACHEKMWADAKQLRF